AGHLWQSQAELRRSQPGFALRATPRSPVAIPVGTKPLAKADPPRAPARGILAKASEGFSEFAMGMEVMHCLKKESTSILSW
ncbi:MAG: hypothetical protein V1758_00940, partial [Pseudomonadota bacterium]